MKQYDVLNIALFKRHLKLTSNEDKSMDPVQFLANTVQEIHQEALNRESSTQAKLED